MTSEARDKIRELRIVAAQCYKMAADAIAARDEAVRNLGKALLDVPAGDWPGAVVEPVVYPDVCSEGARLCVPFEHGKPNMPVCGEHNGGTGAYCSRRPHSTGDHVACGPYNHNLARWPRVPAVEPPTDPDVCSEGARLCVPFEHGWCAEARPGGWLPLYCSRPRGHAGDHVACSAGDHVACSHNHNLARWPRVPAVEPPPVSTIELIQRACNPRIGDLYTKAGGRLVVTAIDDDLVCYVSGPNSKPGVIPTTEWGLLARNTINNGAQFVPAVEPPPGVDCAGCGAE